LSPGLHAGARYSDSFEGDRRIHPRLWHVDYCLLRGLAQQVKSFADGEAVNAKRVLDYGCGAMPYRRYFRSSSYIGVDVCDSDWADMVVDAGEPVPIASGSCDAVISTQVVYMAKDPLAYLTECYRLLCPGGFLFLSTHGTWTYHPASGRDLYRFTQGGITLLLKEAGFRIERLEPVVGTLAAGLHLRQLVWNSFLVSHGLRWLAATLNVITNLRMEFEDRLSPAGMRLSSPVILTCVAKKESDL